MQSKIITAAALALALGLAACSGSPETMLSPTGVPPVTSALNPDGSNLKADAPTNLTPTNDDVIDTVRPTLRFNRARARFAEVEFEHEIEIVNASDRVVYHRESVSGNEHTIAEDLSHSDNFWWRVRARLGGDVGPWSEFAPFRTPAPPGPPAPTPGVLPFPIPAQCGPFGPGDRTACAVAMTQVSPWWAACRAGSGTNCHRFTRSVAWALRLMEDPNNEHPNRGWGGLSKNPGEQQCTWNRCGGGRGEGYGEDVVTHLDAFGVLRAWDIVTGAGAPGANAGWSRIGSFRPGNSWAAFPPLGGD